MKLFKQVRKVMIDKAVVDFENLDIDFNIKCTDDNKSDIAVISIYNLSDTTKAQFKKGQAVSVTAGYKELQGVIFNGTVERIEHHRTENDIATVIVATPNNSLYTNTIVNTQFKANIKASNIINALQHQTTFNIVIRGLGKDITYKNGKCFSNRLSSVIDILARDTNSRARVTNNTIEFTEKDKVYSTAIKLNSSNGLIRVEKAEKKADTEAKEEKEKYSVETLLIPIVKVGQVLDVESTFYTGKLVVKEVEYTAGELNNFSSVATCEVVE